MEWKKYILSEKVRQRFQNPCDQEGKWGPGICEKGRRSGGDRQISRCLGDMKGHDGVLSVLPMKDTVYMTDGKRISSLLDRERIYGGRLRNSFFLENIMRPTRHCF